MKKIFIILISLFVIPVIAGAGDVKEVVGYQTSGGIIYLDQDKARYEQLMIDIYIVAFKKVGGFSDFDMDAMRTILFDIANNAEEIHKILTEYLEKTNEPNQTLD